MKTYYKIPTLGYVKYIDHMGSDETFVEAARMSTGKGFYGWTWEKDTFANAICATCKTQHLYETLPVESPGDEDPESDVPEGVPMCTECWGTAIIPFGLLGTIEGVDHLRGIDPKLLGKEGTPRDFGLLNTLYANKHQTPFEMGELAIEVKAPIFVFREWHRHRTQSYNEFSARYSQMPNEHYIPALERIQRQSKTNKQGSAEAFNEEQARIIRNKLAGDQGVVYRNYEELVRLGVAKEIARINTPVSRFSKMRAKTDVRNWLGFLLLRMEMGAQWEIRQYANAVASIIKQLYPKTFELFLEYDLLGTRYSATEQRFISKFLRSVLLAMDNEEKGAMMYTMRFVAKQVGLPEKKLEALVNKLQTDRSDIFKDVLSNL